MDSHDLSSFGTVLKAFRARRRLTQQQLAAKLGVRRNTVGSWERGDFLPASKTMVLDLARHLKLDPQETRQLLEASLTTLVPYWSVPFPRNPFFTGREAVLEALQAQLGVDRAVALTQSSALHGLGGVGKTQIVLEYAYRHALEYSAVFWIGAETEEQIITSLMQISETLQLPEQKNKDQQRVVVAVQRWLTTHSQWLLICDNVEDMDLLDRFLPSVRQGAILLTTRLRTLGTLARGLELLPMEQEEGMLFLLRRAKVLFPEVECQHMGQLARLLPHQYETAAELVTVLGGLPLALDQAGAYLEETQCALSTYLDLFCTQRAALLALRGDRSRAHPDSVSTTFTLAIMATIHLHPAVQDLLYVCALLYPDAIPEELFRQGAEHLGAQLQAICCNTLTWNQIIATACAYSLLSRQPEEQTLSIHRLVQAVMLDAMTDEEQAQWSSRIIAALDQVLPEVRHTTEYAAWKQCERMLQHALLCVQRAGATTEALPLASLAYKSACYLHRRGRHMEAEHLFQRALHIREQALGPEHPEVAASLNYLAILSLNQGKHMEAEHLFQRALQIWEQALGPEHPRVAISLNDLAVLLRGLGRYAEAEALQLRALQIREQALGPVHPYVAQALNNLAELYWGLGKYLEAEALLLRALQIWEQALGPEHPAVAESLCILANLSREQGKGAEAESLYQRALQIAEQALGSEHPRVAIVLTDLAEYYRRQRRDAEAERLYQQALQIWEQALGPEHLNVTDPLNGLANLFRDRSAYPEAERLYRRVLSLREKYLGQHHPDTAQTLYDLAIFHQKQGHLSEALSLAQHAHSIRLQALGEIHPYTVASRELYAHLMQEQECAQAEAASERCPEAIPDPRDNERHENTASSPLYEVATPVPCENDPLQVFLDACCERHPRAWCRSADLWQAYQQWAQAHQERYLLSRGAFIAQLKAHGCRADRTTTARIWHGIALVKKES